MAPRLNRRPADLGELDDLPVIAAGIELPSAAGGLRDALTIDPELFEHGERAYVVLDVTMNKLKHNPITLEDPDGYEIEGWERVHVFDVNGATFIDADAVKAALADQALKIRKAEDEARGQTTLDGIDNDATP